MTRMIVVVLFALLIQVNSSDAEPRSEHTCADQEGLSREEAYSLFSRPVPSVEEQSNEKLKCFAACLVEHMNIIDGCSYQLEAGKEFAAKTNMTEMASAFEACKDNAKGQERCECGYNLFKCVGDYLESLGGKKSAN